MAPSSGNERPASPQRTESVVETKRCCTDGESVKIVAAHDAFFFGKNYMDMILHKICDCNADWTTSLKPLVRFVTAYKVIYSHFTGPSWPALECTGKQPCQIDSLQELKWLMEQNNRQRSALQVPELMIKKLPIGSQHVEPYLRKLFVEGQKIHMASCALTAIPASLCGSKSLRVLDLSFNLQIDKIEGLKDCLNLEYVAFRNCRIKDITALGQCQKLKHVDLQGLSKLRDVSCILEKEKHPNMKVINVGGTQITNLNKRSEEACDHDLTSLNVMGIGHAIRLDGILARGSSLKNLNLGNHIHDERNIFRTLHDCTPELETLTIAKVFDTMNLDIFFLAHLKRLKHFATKCGQLVQNVVEWAEGKINIPWEVLDLTMASEPHPADMSGALKTLRNLKVLVADDARGCPRDIDCGQCFPESLEVLSLGHSITLRSVTGLKGMSKIKEINLFRNSALIEIQSLTEAQGLQDLYIDHDDAVNASERYTPIAETVKYLRTKTQINVHVTNLQRNHSVHCWSNRTMPILSEIPKDPFITPMFYLTDLRLGEEF
jgi:hypothetical protein